VQTPTSTGVLKEELLLEEINLFFKTVTSTCFEWKTDRVCKH